MRMGGTMRPRDTSIRVFASRSLRRQTLASVSGLTLAMALTSSAAAQSPPPQQAQTNVEEIVVTGTRIVRDGYEAPTPLTVVGPEAIESAARSNIIELVTAMPSLSGSSTPQNSSRNV